MSGLYDTVRGLYYKRNGHKKKKLITVFLLLCKLRFYKSILHYSRYHLCKNLSKAIINIFQIKVFFPMFRLSFIIFSGA